MAIVHITNENFEQEILRADKPALVDFYADWCGPCKMFAPTFEAAASEFGDKAIFAKLDVDQAQEIAAKYRVMNIPTLILFKGGEPVKRLMGVQTKKVLEDLIQG